MSETKPNDPIRSIINKLEPTEWEDLQEYLKERWDQAFDKKRKEQYGIGYNECREKYERDHLLFRVSPEYIERVIQARIESKEYPENSRHDVLILMLTMLTRPDHGK